VLGPVEQGRAPIFIVLNAAPEALTFKFPAMTGCTRWQLVLDTTEAAATAADFAAGAETKAPPRSVLAFAGLA
jgi:glycogen operon protein